MNKVISFSKLYLSLFFIEILIIVIFLVVIDFCKYGVDFFYVKKACFGVGLMSFWRLLFFGLPFLFLYFLLFEYFVNLKLFKPLLFSLFNLCNYILLSFLLRVIWDNNVTLHPEGIMFWITCISIFLSPIVLGNLHYFRVLMDDLLGQG